MAKRSRRPVTPRPTTTPTPTSSPEATPPPADGDAASPSTPSTSSPTSAFSASSTDTSPTPTATPTTSTTRPRGQQKSSNRPRRAVAAPPTFFERFRTPIIAGVAIIGLLVIGYLFLQGSNGPAGTFVASGPNYTCDSLLTPAPNGTLPPPQPTFVPTPTPVPTASPTPAPATAAPSGSGEAGGSPAASASPSTEASAAATDSPTPAGSPTAEPTPVPAPTIPLGFGTEILGRTHIANANQTINYGFCPPTSGDHYNIAGFGPIKAAVYPKDVEQPPGGWVHNLEHGWVVVLYSCKNGCPSDAEMAEMTQWFNDAPTPDPSQGCNKEVLVARFDSMTTRFAQLAWGRAMLTDTFDRATAEMFTDQWMDHGTEPEKTIC